MHELFRYPHAQQIVIHESRFLRQTRLYAEIVGLTRIFIRKLLPHLLKSYNIRMRFTIVIRCKNITI